VSFYGAGDELQLAFNFLFSFSPFAASALRDVVEAAEATLPAFATPCWTLGNHDVSRYGTRWAEGDPRRARAALMLLLGLRGTAVLYYGDELGLPDVEIPDDCLVDPLSIEYRPVVNRDAARTPMPWYPGPGAGFTAPEAEPWLPIGDRDGLTVAEQRTDPTSMLHLTRAVLALRRELPDLHDGPYSAWPTPEGVWAWQRGTTVLVAVNLSETTATVPSVTGTVRLSTDRSRDGDSAGAPLTLRPWEAVIVTLG
jgi:alpha-glucosidase